MSSAPLRGGRGLSVPCPRGSPGPGPCNSITACMVWHGMASWLATRDNQLNWYCSSVCYYTLHTQRGCSYPLMARSDMGTTPGPERPAGDTQPRRIPPCATTPFQPSVIYGVSSDRSVQLPGPPLADNPIHYYSDTASHDIISLVRRGQYFTNRDDGARRDGDPGR